MTPSAASARQVVILARAPSARGKTRLTAHLSAADARALRERLFLDTLSAARAAGYPVVVTFTPADAAAEMRALAGEAAFMMQRGDDLGARMRNGMHDAFATGAATVVLIGSDLPTLPPEHMSDAFAMLDSGADVVFGPSEDGGFYLVGARSELPDIFHGVEWSRPDVLARVTRAAHEAGLTVGVAREWWDVDGPEDLRRCPGYENFAREEH
jgi:uncharacterized protein